MPSAWDGKGLIQLNIYLKRPLISTKERFAKLWVILVDFMFRKDESVLMGFCKQNCFSELTKN
jgi:hypothetical protein